ncbi:MAG: CDP-alcohol phosphatidyltransferase family protein [Proteobacteria bacterium]|nr:CDP-alcohol phosphatidyltransferase family protein [Pseudomonadota bacterium]
MPKERVHRDLAKRIPVLLTALRVLLAPVVAILAVFAPVPAAFAVCLVTAFLSDVFDGVLARRLGVVSANLRRFDSAADTLFYATCLFAAWWLYPVAIRERIVSLSIFAALEAFRYAFDFAKFRREASYHMWSSKVWGLSLFVGVFWILVLGEPNAAAVSLAIYMGIAADCEGLAISVLLPRWRADVPSFVHAMRIRRSGNL